MATRPGTKLSILLALASEMRWRSSASSCPTPTFPCSPQSTQLHPHQRFLACEQTICPYQYSSASDSLFDSLPLFLFEALFPFFLSFFIFWEVCFSRLFLCLPKSASLSTSKLSLTQPRVSTPPWFVLLGSFLLSSHTHHLSLTPDSSQVYISGSSLVF